MSLKHQQTQFLTQASTPVGTIAGFIAASFRVWEWSTGPGTPQELSAITLDVTKRDAVVIKDAGLCFVCDGGGNNFLYSVDTTNPLLPVVLDSVDLSAP